MSPTVIAFLVIVVVVVAVALVILGMRDREGSDPLQERLAEFAERGEAASLHEIEMSQTFVDRILIPTANRLGEVALKVTPQKALDTIHRKLEMAGNPSGIQPTTFFVPRFVLAVLFGAGLVLGLPRGDLFAKLLNFIVTIGATVFGFMMPNMLLDARINRRQDEVRKALPDALDLLTICVEAGLGFDAAMRKVADKWDNELSIAFGRALQEIQLGKTAPRSLA